MNQYVCSDNICAKFEYGYRFGVQAMLILHHMDIRNIKGWVVKHRCVLCIGVQPVMIRVFDEWAWWWSGLHVLHALRFYRSIGCTGYCRTALKMNNTRLAAIKKYDRVAGQLKPWYLRLFGRFKSNVSQCQLFY